MPSAPTDQALPNLQQPDLRAVNPIAPERPKAVEQVGEPIYEWLRRQNLQRFDRIPDPATVKEWVKCLQHIFGYMELTDTKKVARAINQLDEESRKHRWYRQSFGTSTPPLKVL